MEELQAEMRTLLWDGQEEHGGRGEGEEDDGKGELERGGASEVACYDLEVVDSHDLGVGQTSEVQTQEAETLEVLIWVVRALGDLKLVDETYVAQTSEDQMQVVQTMVVQSAQGDQSWKGQTS